MVSALSSSFVSNTLLIFIGKRSAIPTFIVYGPNLVKCILLDTGPIIINVRVCDKRVSGFIGQKGLITSSAGRLVRQVRVLFVLC